MSKEYDGEVFGGNGGPGGEADDGQGYFSPNTYEDDDEDGGLCAAAHIEGSGYDIEPAAEAPVSLPEYERPFRREEPREARNYDELNNRELNNKENTEPIESQRAGDSTTSLSFNREPSDASKLYDKQDRNAALLRERHSNLPVRPEIAQSGESRTASIAPTPHKRHRDKKGTNENEKKGGSGCFMFTLVILVLIILCGIAMSVIMSNIPRIDGDGFAWQWPFGPGSGDAVPGDFFTQGSAAPPATPAPTVRALPELGSKEQYVIDPYHPTADVAEQVGPSVVAVMNMAKQGISNDEYEYGDGSGIVVSQDGYIVTNYHVVKDSSTIYVSFMGEDAQFSAQLMGYDEIRDIAIIKVDRKSLKPAKIGDSDKIRAGEIAVTIGNPLGTLSGSVTQGIISAASRNIEDDTGRLQRFIQIDAPINPGNSGGALVNSKGELIGINTSKAIYAGFDEYTGMPITAEGIGYAIPINDAMPIIESLIKFGYIDRPALGVTGANVDQKMIVEKKCPRGAIVQEVREGSPAEKAGIQVNDIIFAADGKSVSSFSELAFFVESHKVGDEMPLSVWRDGQSMILTAKLISRSEIYPAEADK